MDFCLATFAALFLLFGPASCAPAGLSLQDACEAVRSSSLKLNHIAKDVSIEARNGSQAQSNFTTSLGWMEANDMCDPGTLKRDSASCIGKILDVLRSYSSAMDRIAEFKSCSQYVSKVKPEMEKLHNDVRTYVKSKGLIHHKKESHHSNTAFQRINHWQEALLCQYTMDRLFSFSILTARVFAVGDPAHHAEGSAQKCM